MTIRSHPRLHRPPPRRRLIGLGLLIGLVLWPLVHRVPPAVCPPGLAVGTVNTVGVGSTH